MKPEVGQHVKCFMRASNLVLEGKVQEWSDTQVVLMSLGDEGDKNLLIIHRPADDIVMTKIILQEPVSEVSEIKEKILEKLREVQVSTGDPELDKLKAKELRQLAIEQDKKMVSEKIKEHFSNTGTVQTKYSSAYMPGVLPFRKVPEQSLQSRSAYKLRRPLHGSTRFYKKPRPE